MSVFIKFMGTVQKEYPKTDKEGRVLVGGEVEIRNIDQYYVYSGEEFLIMDADGGITGYQPNPYGAIPFVYCNSSATELIPTPDSDNLQMAILIPKLLTDLNYASQFCSHSVIYGIDIEVQNLEQNPDSFWVISSKEGSDKTPSIGTIQPTVDSDKVIALIETQLGMWLDSKGIKSSASGVLGSGNISGISKLIDEGDSSSVTKKQTNQFVDFEDDLWDLIQTMHGYWASTQQLAEIAGDFSIDFEPTIKFEEHKIIEDNKTKLDEIKLMFDMGITTPRMALKKLNPSFTDEQIQTILDEINAYKQDNQPLLAGM
jgi:hypothetical protein